MKKELVSDTLSYVLFLHPINNKLAYNSRLNFTRVFDTPTPNYRMQVFGI
jgi:hypothetical protein